MIPRSDLLPPQEDCPPVVSPAVLATWFGVSTRTVLNWSREGILPQPVRYSERRQVYRVAEVRQALLRLESETWSLTTRGTNGEAI